jgi:hypothetical protein
MTCILVKIVELNRVPAIMKQIYLIHWNKTEATEKAIRIREMGYGVSFDISAPIILKQIRANPPDIFLIDLSRLPSQGRDIALNFRLAGATRHIPIIFVGGLPEKVERVKESLPDAIYASWDEIENALQTALSRPLKEPVVPDSIFEPFKDVPLHKKLGIKEGITLGLFDSPDNIFKILGKLPKNITLAKTPKTKCDLAIWFVVSQKELNRQFGAVSKSLADKGALWIAWPKKSSAIQSDLTQAVVRKIGLDSGLVDYKICAIDKTWSALKFTRKKKK